MKNRHKNLFILLLFIAASFVGVKGAAAATGNATATTAMGNVAINLGGAASVAVNIPPLVFGHDGETSQQVLNDAYLNAQSTWSNQPLDIYTIPCWTFHVSLANTGANLNSGGYVCSLVDSGPASNDLGSVESEQVGGTLGTANPMSCELSNPNYSACGPVVRPNLQPTAQVIDALIGQTVTYSVVTNWCSYIAPTGAIDGASVSVTGVAIGCAVDDPAITFGPTVASGDRLLSATNDSTSRSATLDIQVKASAYDCHVPKVKGLTLAKAKLRLHQAHCGSTVRYVRGKAAGRVRYQPIKIGTGKPKDYKVTLSVVR